MLYVNFTVDEKNEIKMIGCSTKPSTEISLLFSQTEDKDWDVYIFFSKSLNPEIKDEFRRQKYKKEALELLNTLPTEVLKQYTELL